MKIIAAFTVGLALAGMLSAAPAQAQNTRSFVSGHGSDTNACTLAAPCRTFAAAFAATNPSGEIDVLDPGGYGALTINKAISIQGHGFSGISAASGDAIKINGGASDEISLNGLLFDGVGTGFSGIEFDSGASLTVKDCLIRNFGWGIQFLPIASSKLSVSNTVVSDNRAYGIVVNSGTGTTAVLNRVEVNNNGVDGVYTASGGVSILSLTIVDSVAANNGSNGINLNANNVTLSNVTATGNQYGILVDGHFVSSSSNVTIEDSNASNNSLNGITVQSSGEVNPVVMVRNSVVSNNQNGLSSNPGGNILLARTAVTGNSATGALLNGGFIYTYGDNNIDRNLTNQVAGGSLTSILTR